MEAKLAPSANLLALPDGTDLVGDYRIRRVLGAGGFGITYLADEKALSRLVTIKEYFPAEFAARRDRTVAPRSREATGDYQWGLDRFIEEAQTLARFDHPNIVRVHRYFRANNTAYMVLHFEEGGSFKAWLGKLKRAPRQRELDRMIAPLLDALDAIHRANFLHRDIAPDNIMVRKDGSPVLIDFGSARVAIASQSRTVSALVKPGYSPYEQYATTGANQGPWTDVYALGATLYHAVTGKRPPDAPSRVVSDEYVPAREAALSSYRGTFLDAIDKALRLEVDERPQTITEWRKALLASTPASAPAPARRLASLGLPITQALGRLRGMKPEAGAASSALTVLPTAAAPSISQPASLVPAPPDAPQPKGQLLDFIEAIKKRRPLVLTPRRGKTAPAPGTQQIASASARAEPAAPRLSPDPQFGLGYGPAPSSSARAATESEAAKPAPRALLRAPSKTQARPRRWLWRRWHSGLFKVAAAVAVASLAVAYQERATRSATGPGAPASEATASADAKRLLGHQGPVIAVGTADEGRWIVSAGADATLRLWSAASGALVRTINLGEGAATAFAADARRALVGHRTGAIVLWDLELGEKLATFQHGNGSVTSVEFLGEGFVAARQDGSVALFSLSTPSAPPVLLDAEDGGGPLLAAARAHGVFVAGGADRAVRLWRAPGPRLARTYRRLTDDITAIGISADARRIAGGNGEGVVRVWPSPAWSGVRSRAVQRLKAHEGRVTAIALGPPNLLATAGQEGSVKIWSLHPMRIVRSLPAGQVNALSFSPDGRQLLAGARDGTVQVWSVPAATGAT